MLRDKGCVKFLDWLGTLNPLAGITRLIIIAVLPIVSVFGLWMANRVIYVLEDTYKTNIEVKQFMATVTERTKERDAQILELKNRDKEISNTVMDHEKRLVRLELFRGHN